MIKKLLFFLLISICLTSNANAGSETIGIGGNEWAGNVTLDNSKIGIPIGSYVNMVIPSGDLDNNFSSSDGYIVEGNNISITGGKIVFEHVATHENRLVKLPLINPRNDVQIYFDLNLTDAINLDLEKNYIALTKLNETLYSTVVVKHSSILLEAGHWSGVYVSNVAGVLSSTYIVGSPTYSSTLNTTYHVSLNRIGNQSTANIYDYTYSLLNSTTITVDTDTLNYFVVGGQAVQGVMGGTVDNLLAEDVFENGTIYKNWTSSIPEGEELSILSYNGSGAVNIYASTDGISYTLISDGAISGTDYDVSGNSYEYAKFEQNGTSPINNITGTWAASGSSFDLFIINKTQTLEWFNITNIVGDVQPINLTWTNRTWSTGYTAEIFYANGTTTSISNTTADVNGNTTLSGALVEGTYYISETSTAETFVLIAGAFALVASTFVATSGRFRRAAGSWLNQRRRRN